MTRAQSVDTPSIDHFGERSEALGFPLSGLSTLDADLQPFADAVRDRYGRIVNRLASLEAVVNRDAGWLEPLIHLDLGDNIHFTRRAITPELTLDALVCGYEHRIIRNDWRTTIYTTTTTRSI